MAAGLSLEEHFDVLETSTRLARHGLVVLRFDPDERLPHIEWANEIVVERSHLSQSELVAYPSPLFELDDNRALATYARMRAQTGSGEPFELKLVDRDRRPYWVECLAFPLDPSPAGAFRCVVTSSEIESRKALESYARLLAQAVDRQPDGVLIVRVDAAHPLTPGVVYVNAAFTALTGYTLADFSTSRYPNIIRHEEDRTTVRHLAGHVYTGGNIATDVRLTRADGSEFWAQIRAHAIESPAEHAVMTIADVTERRSMQERMTMLSEAVSNASDFVIVTDDVPPSRGGPAIRYVNRAFLQATGFHESDTVGRPYLSLFSTANQPGIMAAMEERIERGEENFREVLLRRKHDDDFWVELVERPFQTQSGGLRLNVSRDITLRRRTSNQLSLLLSAVESSPMPMVMYEPQADDTLAVVYENQSALELHAYYLLELWQSPAMREAILRKRQFTTTHTHVGANGELRVSRFTAHTIRNESRVESILTQDFFVGGGELLTTLPSITHGGTVEERTSALRILLRTAFDAELEVTDRPALPGPVRIDAEHRVATFELDGCLAHARWPAKIQARALTALRLWIETAIES